jgi:centromeric protein E
MHLSHSITFKCKVYKEHIRDLLAQSAAAPPVRMFDGPDGLVIRGLREEVVTSPEQVFAVLAQGEARRQVGATHANAHSSRSHVMVRIWIESSAVTGNSNVRVSSLSLVDLAGSESVKLSGSSDRRTEGHYINKSLMTLGQVVYALSEETGKKTHVPYRDSKLTRLLQPSLSGNAQVVLVCCISPLVTHVEESHNTFKFATRAKKIPQKATIQENVDEKTLLESYREEIETLRLQLKEARDQQLRQDSKAQLSSQSSNVSTASTTDEMDEDEIIELAEAIQTMEKLILKSKPIGQQQPEDMLDSSEQEITDDDEEKLMALVGSLNSAITPSKPTSAASAPATPLAVDKNVSKDLHEELSRVQGLLGSVLKKRSMKGTSTPKMAATSDREVRDLRAQLERQQVTTSLNKADSSFLQKQLEEKDDLLLEVSKILEAVEDRQTQLEAENAALRKELIDLKASKVLPAKEQIGPASPGN